MNLLQRIVVLNSVKTWTWPKFKHIYSGLKTASYQRFIPFMDDLWTTREETVGRLKELPSTARVQCKHRLPQDYEGRGRYPQHFIRPFWTNSTSRRKSITRSFDGQSRAMERPHEWGSAATKYRSKLLVQMWQHPSCNKWMDEPAQKHSLYF